jgi:hypothetical protein
MTRFTGFTGFPGFPGFPHFADFPILAQYIQHAIIQPDSTLYPQKIQVSV